MRCTGCGGTDLARDGALGGLQRYRCTNKDCGKRTTAPDGVEEARSLGIEKKLVAALHRKIRKAKRLVITSAQNATPVWQPFLEALQIYCAANDALLVVIPYRYKNATSIWNEKNKRDDWWALDIMPNLYDRRVQLNKHLVLLGDIKTQPTASSPLQGFETLTGAKSAIVGHPKLELATIPTPQARLPKILTTTGSITMKNYVPAKAGKKGEHHHTFGACIVEIDGGLFHMRQINAARDGSFYDMAGGRVRHYSCETVRAAKARGLVMGDTHVEFVDPQVVEATFGPGGIVPAAKPDALVWHDVHDFYSRNHHHRGKVFINQVKHQAGLDDVEAGLDQTFAFIDAYSPAGATNVVVNSNHPNALARWIEEADWKADPRNAAFYLRTALAMTEAARMSPTGAKTIDPFKYWGERKLKSIGRTKFLGAEEAYQIEGIEVGYHGHDGPNGARGNIRSFGKIGAKTVIGHSHTPGIKDGVYQVGTSSQLRLEFVKGPSSWLHTHCVIYPNGKRTLVNIVDGRWRA
jgi:hypothetical protein